LQVEYSAPRTVTTNIRFEDINGSSWARAVNAKIYGAAAVTEWKQFLRPEPKTIRNARAPKSFVNLLDRAAEIVDGTPFDPDQTVGRAKASIADPHVDVTKQLWEREPSRLSNAWTRSSDTHGKSFAACQSAMSVSGAPERTR
jgi:hypothetical protein